MYVVQQRKKEYVNEIFQIDNKRVLVEHIPAVVLCALW